jgi:hypothetical protein
MFDEYRGQVVNLRRAGQRLAASVQILEETDLADDASVARWLDELERAATASGEALRRASELRTAITGAWPRPVGPGPDPAVVDESAAHDVNAFG